MKLRPFELALLTVFAVVGLIALGLLAAYDPGPSDEGPALTGEVVVWGSVSREGFDAVLQPLREELEAYRQVSYVEIDARNFDSQLLNALAEGRGPDVLLLPHHKLVQHRNKLQPIPYDSLPLPDFRSQYIDGSEIFLLPDGVYALPVAIDPLMMYWNRDILTSAGFITPPRSWEQIVSEIVPQIVNRDASRNIVLSPLAFGEYRNVRNAYEVLSMLLIQGGSQLVTDTDWRYEVALNTAVQGDAAPLVSALSFYTGFASPSNALYSWNRSLPQDRAQFLAERLALYFGYGSEARALAAQNPNLNFDIAEVPQSTTSSIRRTYGTFYGLALLRSSDNQNEAYSVMRTLAAPGNAHTLTQSIGMAPAHRQTLMSGSNDRYGRLIYSSAVVARGWLNPDLEQTNSIFTQAVESILANRSRPSDAADDIVGRLRLAY